MIALADIYKIKDNIIIYNRGKRKEIIARYDLFNSGRGYTAFKSDSGGSYNYLNETYGSDWWCQPIVQITKEKWDSIPDDYKGCWGEWIREQGFQPDLPDEYLGKRTVFEGCIYDSAGTALLTEGIHFIIKE